MSPKFSIKLEELLPLPLFVAFTSLILPVLGVKGGGKGKAETQPRICLASRGSHTGDLLNKARENVQGLGAVAQPPKMRGLQAWATIPSLPSFSVFSESLLSSCCYSPSFPQFSSPLAF